MEISTRNEQATDLTTSTNPVTTEITTDSQNQQTEATTAPTDTDFDSFMLKALNVDTAQNVNEEELFAGIIGQRMSLTNKDAAEHYESTKANLMISMARADGYVNVEEVANTALQDTVQAGKITSEEAQRIKSDSFAAAQLDDNLTALYDDRGSGSDPTIAVSQMESALLSMKTTLSEIDNGNLTPEQLTLESTDGGKLSGSQEMDGSNGFLWKPISESNGNLVVLLPTDLKGLIDKVEIHSNLPPTEDTKIEEGNFAGDTHNGGRAHFRFDKPGAEYGDNVHLVVIKDDGSNVNWAIGDGSQRYD